MAAVRMVKLLPRSSNAALTTALPVFLGHLQSHSCLARLLSGNVRQCNQEKMAALQQLTAASMAGSFLQPQLDGLGHNTFTPHHTSDNTSLHVLNPIIYKLFHFPEPFWCNCPFLLFPLIVSLLLLQMLYLSVAMFKFSLAAQFVFPILLNPLIECFTI